MATVLGRVEPPVIGHIERLAIPLILLALPVLFIPTSLTNVDFAWQAGSRMQSLAAYAAIFGTVAYGLGLLIRLAGLPSVVHGALWGVGAYAAGLAVEEYDLTFWAALPLAAIVPTALALVLAVPALRTSGMAFLLITIALGEFVVLTLTNWEELTHGPAGLVILDTPALGPLKIETVLDRYYFSLSFMYGSILIMWLVGRSSFGRRLSAIRDNESLARSLGINAFLYKSLVFMLSAAIVGVAGELYLYHQKAITPDLFGTIPFITVVLMVVMGGTTSLAGPAIGAWIVQFLPEWFGPLGLDDPNRQRLAFGLLLMAFMIAAPEGLAGRISSGYVRLKRLLWTEPPPTPLLVPIAGSAGLGTSTRGQSAIRSHNPILTVRGAVRRFGALRAVDGVDLEVYKHEILGIIGPNGSGKTTLFSCVSGFLPLSAGRINWCGQDITKWPADRVARGGLVRTFQHPMVFPSTTALESCRVAVESRRAIGRWRERESSLPTSAEGLLEFCGLREMAHVPVGALPYGYMRTLGVALALATSPALLLLDEPAAGLSAQEAAELQSLLRVVRDAGVTLVVVDHHMPFLMPLAERVIVLDAGVKICEGTPTDVQWDPRVIASYLGEKFARRAGILGDEPE